MNIDNAIQYPFSIENWKKPFFSIFLMLFLTTGLLNLFSLFGQFGGAAFTESDPREVGPIFILIFGFIMILVLLSIPVGAYLTGYLLKIYESVRADSKIVPEHKDVFTTIIEGLKLIVIALAYGLLPMMLLIASLVAVIFGFGLTAATGMEVSGSLGIVIGIVGLILFFLTFAFILVLGAVITPAYIYEYLKNRSISDAFNFAAVKRNVELGWKDFLVAYGLIIVANMVVGFAGAFLFCIGFIAQPLGQTYLLYFQGYMYGQAFRDLDKTLKVTR
jgi:hypothetical protein